MNPAWMSINYKQKGRIIGAVIHPRHVGANGLVEQGLLCGGGPMRHQGRVSLVFPGKEIPDYFPADVQGQFFSRKARVVLQACLMSFQNAIWTPVDVVDAQEHVHEFYQFSLTDEPSSVDDRLSLYNQVAGQKFLMKPVFSLSKLEGRHLTAVGGDQLYCDGLVRMRLEEGKCTGIGYSQAPLVP
jgi:hypothetical protein